MSRNCKFQFIVLAQGALVPLFEGAAPQGVRGV